MFSSFYANVVTKCKDLTAEPTLPLKEDHLGIMTLIQLLLHFIPESFYRKQYYEALDVVIGELKRRFQQEQGIPVAAALERVLLDSVQGSFNETVLPRELDMLWTVATLYCSYRCSQILCVHTMT